MRRVLCILTSPPDRVTETVIATEKEQPERSVRTFDLTAPNPDYDKLLDAIFEADSVQVW